MDRFSLGHCAPWTANAKAPMDGCQAPRGSFCTVGLLRSHLFRGKRSKHIQRYPKSLWKMLSNLFIFFQNSFQKSTVWTLKTEKTISTSTILKIPKSPRQFISYHINTNFPQDVWGFFWMSTLNFHMFLNVFVHHNRSPFLSSWVARRTKEGLLQGTTAGLQATQTWRTPHEFVFTRNKQVQNNTTYSSTVTAIRFKKNMYMHVMLLYVII